jgi:hypothetical protein
MNSAPRKYSQNSGKAHGEPALGAVDDEGADDGADQRGAAAHGRPDRDLDDAAVLISPG